MIKGNPLILIILTALFLFNAISIFGQCGPDGTHPCKPTPKKTTTKKTTSTKKTPNTAEANTKITNKKPAAKIDKTKLAKDFIESKTGIVLKEIPEGNFEITSFGNPVQFKLDYKFLMSKFEVTQAQWKAVMGTNPSHFSLCGGDCPIENVSWDEAKSFIEKLNALQNEYLFRLPTETEWDWACNCGIDNPFFEKPELVAWYQVNSGNITHRVGQKQPNSYGLYDMNGNVAEWCEDIYIEEYAKLPKDGVPNQIGETFRSIRGGSFFSTPRGLGFNGRDWKTPDYRISDIGFRIAARKLSDMEKFYK